MKLNVGGKTRIIPSKMVTVLESQFIDLQASLEKEGLSLTEWMDVCKKNNLDISILLRNSKRGALATDIGIAFLKNNNFPCPKGH